MVAVPADYRHHQAAVTISGASSTRKRGKRKVKRPLRRSPTVSHNVIISSVIREFDPLVNNVATSINMEKLT